MAISMAETTHCKKCRALVYKDETYLGLGFRCGCLLIYVRKLQKAAKKAGVDITSLR